MDVYSAMLSASLAERRLAYSTTCSVRVLFAVVRFFMVARSSAVACARLAKSIENSMVLFAVPV